MAKSKKKKASNDYISPNKKGRILVTFAGGTDPLGGEYVPQKENKSKQNKEVTKEKKEERTDGPIIRICRFYRPEKIYLLLTAEMSEVHKLNIYEEAIKSNIDFYEFEIIPIELKIDKAHHFNIFSEKIPEVFEMVRTKHPNAEILVNVTSGTAQMTTNLVSYIVNASGMNLKPIQVESPAGKSNYHEVDKYKEGYNAQERASINKDKRYFDEIIRNSEKYKKYKKGNNPEISDTDKLVEIFDDLQKEDDSITKTRLLTPDLDYYRRVLIKGNIEKLLDKYEYGYSLNLLEQKVFANQEQIEEILKFAQLRKDLQGIESNEILKEIIKSNEEFSKYAYHQINAKKKDIPLWYMLVDYYVLAKMKAKIGDCASYTLMLEPLTTNLYLSILQDVLGQNLKDLFVSEELPLQNKKTQHNTMYKLTENKYNKIDEGEFAKFDKGNIKFDKSGKSYVNTYNLEKIIEYFIKKEEKKEKDKYKKLKEFYEYHKKGYEEVKKLRNAFAHSLNSIPINDFINITGVDINALNDNFEGFFNEYYTGFGYNENMTTIYDDLNKIIIDMLKTT